MVRCVSQCEAMLCSLHSGFHLVERGSEESVRAQLTRRFVGTGKVARKGGGHDNFTSNIESHALPSTVVLVG